MNFLASLVSKVLAQLIEKLGKYISDWLARKKEQKDRHKETSGKVEDFKNAQTAQEAKDTFDRLP